MPSVSAPKPPELLPATARRSRSGMARNILDEVVKEVESRKLEEWESLETLAQPLALYFQALGDSEEDQQRKRELYAKICRLDPAQALAFAPMD